MFHRYALISPVFNSPLQTRHCHIPPVSYLQSTCELYYINCFHCTETELFAKSIRQSNKNEKRMEKKEEKRKPFERKYSYTDWIINLHQIDFPFIVLSSVPCLEILINNLFCLQRFFFSIHPILRAYFLPLFFFSRLPYPLFLSIYVVVYAVMMRWYGLCVKHHIIFIHFTNVKKNIYTVFRTLRPYNLSSLV